MADGAGVGLLGVGVGFGLAGLDGVALFDTARPFVLYAPDFLDFLLYACTV